MKSDILYVSHISPENTGDFPSVPDIIAGTRAFPLTGFHLSQNLFGMLLTDNLLAAAKDLNSYRLFTTEYTSGLIFRNCH